MEIKYYYLGGISELRFSVNFTESKICVSAVWANGRYNLDQEVLPLNPEKITGSLCQYMLKTLTKLNDDHGSDIIRDHVRNINKYIQLMMKIGYEKLDRNLKNRLCICMQQGYLMWKSIMQGLIEYSEDEFRSQVKEISRYIIILEVVLLDYFTLIRK